MQVQLLNLSKQSAWEFFSKYFGLNNSYNQSGIFAILLTNCNETYFTSFYDFHIFQVEDKLLIPGRIEELNDFANGISVENPELSVQIIRQIDNYFNFENQFLILNNVKYELTYPLTMGILNVTPDSFSDGGKYLNHSKAIEHAIEMINLGTEIIDIGGESSRPGAEKVSIDEEIKRVIPVIEEIHRLEKNIPISIDTTKAEVAHAALQAGATIVNDISAFSFDERILEVVYNFNATYILMHIKGNPQNMQNNPFYEEPVSEIYNFLARKLDLLNELELEKVIIDPGIGFGKRVSDNFKLIERLDEFKTLGKPIMVGLSKKSFLGKSLNLDINSRENATSISEYMAVLNGARIIRTHNVQNVMEMKKLFQFYKYPNITSVYD